MRYGPTFEVAVSIYPGRSINLPDCAVGNGPLTKRKKPSYLGKVADERDGLRTNDTKFKKGIGHSYMV